MTKTLFLSLFAAAAIGMSAPAKSADAADFHIQTRGFHLDVGNPHYGHSHYRSYYGGPYSYGRSTGYRGYSHSRYHDTSHYDYHPGYYQRHYDHYDYVPGHYHYHRSGHYHH